MSTLQEVAAVLRIDTAVLLGRDVQPAGVIERTAEVERIRAALSRYEIPLARPAGSRPAPPATQMARQVAHAWTAFQHARYPRVVDLLPELLTDVERTHAGDPMAGRVLLVEAYRITTALMVKLGAPDLAWLAADRAMNVATGDPVLVAAAAVQLGQVLRASGQAWVATSAMLAAAYRIAPPVIEFGLPPELSLCGALLVQAALAAACHGDEAAVAGLLDEAAALAARVGDGRDHHRSGFGPTAVESARVAAAVELGDGGDAGAWHEKATTRDGWRWLPAEHRAAHLIDAARAYLQTDDPISAARVLVEADRVAPAEIRHRPAGRDVLAQVVRDPRVPTALIHLAATLGVG
ncbi:XRE family transcriptional regulator [Micromonospora rosaria]|uniref:XRE family transcriptional regulator n=1 Tax=Micromonospora rosaria TaxID=47874 RepID=A0A136PNX3_9ACTN|nr:XRE family transcriptional regulator [Micromonospora rosaria]KXK60048.1 XRE family transcriptional regulator [Micromonospora rosaria]